MSSLSKYSECFVLICCSVYEKLNQSFKFIIENCFFQTSQEVNSQFPWLFIVKQNIILVFLQSIQTHYFRKTSWWQYYRLNSASQHFLQFKFFLWICWLWLFSHWQFWLFCSETTIKYFWRNRTHCYTNYASSYQI